MALALATKEERIVVLETENAALHLKLAEIKAFDLEQSLQEVTERYEKEKQKRRVLHNSLVAKKLLRKINHCTLLLRVYSAFESQDTVFADVAPLLTSLLDGLISEKPPGSYWVEVSVVEVYNNEIFDLLAKDSCGKVFGVKRDVVTTREGKSNVPLLTYETVENASEFLHLVIKGLQLRVRHPTLVHAHSSRSHLVVTLTITTVVSGDSFGTSWEDEQISQRLNKEFSCTYPQKTRENRSTSSSRASSPAQLEATEKPKQVRTRLQLVDLAGSECVGMSGVTGAALRETSFINRSLSALADVLGAIAEQRSHVPYRNSKLTHLLQDSVGGDAKLLVMLCISPDQKYLTESLQSLGFGTRARQVQRGQIKKKNLPVQTYYSLAYAAKRTGYAGQQC
ncbi:Kinesin-like protein KIF25 [Aix galericulata]|nr:Kinesin-like protein KIF25 [Aix galericulata]